MMHYTNKERPWDSPDCRPSQGVLLNLYLQVTLTQSSGTLTVGRSVCRNIGRAGSGQ